MRPNITCVPDTYLAEQCTAAEKGGETKERTGESEN